MKLLTIGKFKGSNFNNTFSSKIKVHIYIFQIVFVANTPHIHQINLNCHIFSCKFCTFLANLLTLTGPTFWHIGHGLCHSRAQVISSWTSPKIPPGSNNPVDIQQKSRVVFLNLCKISLWLKIALIWVFCQKTHRCWFSGCSLLTSNTVSPLKYILHSGNFVKDK